MQISVKCYWESANQKILCQAQMSSAGHKIPTFLFHP